MILQIYSFILSKRVRLVFYELSLSQGRRGLSYLENCDLFVSVCGGGGGEWLFTVFLKASSSVQHTSIFERLHKILDREDECLTVSGQFLLMKIPTYIKRGNKFIKIWTCSINVHYSAVGSCSIEKLHFDKWKSFRALRRICILICACLV